MEGDGEVRKHCGILAIAECLLEREPSLRRQMGPHHYIQTEAVLAGPGKGLQLCGQHLMLLDQMEGTLLVMEPFLETQRLNWKHQALKCCLFLRR